ncbi:MAG: hypothetical protein ABIX01_06400 [Chitinophagaceae bacterium]
MNAEQQQIGFSKKIKAGLIISFCSSIFGLIIWVFLEAKFSNGNNGIWSWVALLSVIIAPRLVMRRVKTVNKKAIQNKNRIEQLKKSIIEAEHN